MNILKKAFPYYGKIYGILILCIFLGLMQGVVALVEPQIITLIVDRVINPALGEKPEANSSIFSFLIEDIPSENLWEIMVLLVGVFLLFMFAYFVAFYIRWNIAHYFSIKRDNEIRLNVLKKINSYGLPLLKEYSAGDLITIVNADTENVRNYHVATIPFIIDSLFYILVASYMLFRINVVLMLIPLSTLLINALITRGFLKVCHEKFGQLWGKNSELNTETQESIYGIRTIKSYAREDIRKESFNRRSEDLRDFSTGFGIQRFRYFLAFDTVEQFVMLISMAVCIYLASRFQMTSGEYTGFLVYMVNICGSFIDIIFYQADAQEQKVSADRLFGLLDKEDEIGALYGTKMVSETPHVKLSHVSAKADENELLDDISLDIPYGKKIGIMGRTGSGKSVLLRVIQAFEEFYEGTVTIDGEDIKSYSRNEIARAYGYAMQNVFLFSNSIEANIAYYNPNASEEEVKACGETAQVSEFVDDFPQGYQTVIGEKGFGLSGGQKQRVAIARALLKNAPITVLDDCTSALDIETESKIFKSLDQHFQGKTLLMATHRAMALKGFDEIIFMDHGKIVERGTFEELMELNGRYADIYRQQMDKEVFVSE
ncbi:MAG: ABC transporter ATP-binding protein [Lachnospiraceae bacterium]|jgi:ATP-binding cassette subfamily B protein|nr:ABC transporter ATP-binding protein [Lachnospiraceae bacterium]